MRLIEREGLADELLPAAADSAEVAGAAHVDHLARRDPRAAFQRHPVAIDPLGHALHDRIGGQRGAHRGVEPFGLDRLVALVERPDVGREMDVVGRPAMDDQRLDQPTVGGGDIAVEKRPEVVAADAVARFDQHDRHVGALRGERHRGESAGQPPTNDDQRRRTLHALAIGTSR